MMHRLKAYIQNREIEPIIDLVNQYPEVLEATDENGSSGFLLIAYSGLEDAFRQAKLLKTAFSLAEAIVAGELTAVKAHLEKDESMMNRPGEDGFTPLALAAFFDQIEIAEFLLDRGGDPNVRASNPMRVNALHAAVAKENVALCRRFLEQGADANTPQDQNVTPLHSAAHRGNLPLVQLLVEYGADITFPMDNGDTAVRITERDGHQEVSNYLKAILATSATEQKGKSS